MSTKRTRQNPSPSSTRSMPTRRSRSGRGSNGAPVVIIDRQQAFSGTNEVEASLRIDAGSLESYLTTNVAGFSGPLDVRQFKGGQSNPTYLLETPRRRYVLRRKPPGKLLPSAHAVDREYRVIRALHAHGFPVA